MKYFTTTLTAFFLCLSVSLYSADYDVIEQHYFSDEYEIPNYIAFAYDNMPTVSELDEVLAPYWKTKSDFELKLKDEFEDQSGDLHLKYVQTYKGYEIEFAEWILHSRSGSVYSMNGKLCAQYPKSSEIVLSESLALESALSYVDADIYKWQLKAEEDFLKQIEQDPKASYFPEGELVFVSKDLDINPASLRLCYKFNIYANKPMSRQEVYVDAANGDIVFTNNLIHTANSQGTANTGYSGQQTITTDSLSANSFRLRQTALGNGVNTYDLNNGTSFAAAVDFTNNSNIWSISNAQQDQYALDAHWGAEQTYQYLSSQFSRNSIDGNGFALTSYVHYSNNYVNAFWNGQYMTYGDGNATVTPLTALDIAGHEIAHGLTTFSADLIYQRESGALNESFSDIFGTAIEFYARPNRANWTMGEDIGFSLRNMANPNQYNDPDTYGGTNWLNQVGCIPSNQNDLCGVHINSGVQNFWFYLVSTGGTGTNDNNDNYSVNSIGISKAAAVAYRNLTVYLGRNSDFQEARFYAIRSAIDLYGACSNEVASVTRAWYAVGVGNDYTNTVTSSFSSSDTVSCQTPLTVSFFDESVNGISYDWDFGNGMGDTVRNPVHTYTNYGQYDVTLIVDGGNCGTDTLVKTAYVDIDTSNACVAILGNGTNPLQTDCNGKILDSGGSTGDYTNNEFGWITIKPQGASSVSLSFPSFDVESGSSPNLCDFDFVEVFDGDTTAAPLIGKYCNNQLPPATITSTRGEITIRFKSDGGLVRSGFEIDWSCNFPSAAPAADFGFDQDSSCTGTINFVDRSTQAPNAWVWDFGDGTTSSLRDPKHTYVLDGTYTVSLTTTNSFGSDSVVKSNIIHVDRPVGPTVNNDTTCFGQPVTLSASGNGNLRWFDDEFAGNLVNTGATFNLSQPASDSLLWVEDYIRPATQITGEANNNFGTGGNYNGDQHLIFDVFSTMILSDVFVYANGSGQRTIELRDNNGVVLQSKTLFVANGLVNLSLDFTIEPGTNYQLGVDYAGTGPNLYRNSSGANYPYTVPGLMSIKRSSANTNPTGYYYFFYYWRVKEPDCVSPRVPVLAKLDTTCGITSLNERSLDQQIRFYPNPAKEAITIELPSHKGNLEVDLWSLEGKKVRELYVSNQANNSSKQEVELTGLPVGLYFIRITNQSETTTKRLVIH